MMQFNSLETTIVTHSIAEFVDVYQARTGKPPITAVAIGNFDGVHLGHQHVLKSMVAEARALDVESIVVTFQPPSKVLFQGKPYLTSWQEKVNLLRPLGFSGIIVIPFTPEYAQTPKQTFLDELVTLTPTSIVVGDDFRFGKERQGRLDDLESITPNLNIIKIQKLKNEPIKSSHIRRLLEQGKLDEVNTFLGRPYSVTGEVVEGDRRGRTLGYPTANIIVPPQKALPKGVFAVTVDVPQGIKMGMANVGTRPTFETQPPSLEVNIFDYDEDIYGETITVVFNSFLRDQRVFAGLEDLKSQLSQDASRARAFFKTNQSNTH